jgi:hypothetical protein
MFLNIKNINLNIKNYDFKLATFHILTVGINSKMAKQNPWIIGILGVGVFLYLAWNNFEMSFAPWTKTVETKAEITDNAIGYGPMGRGYTQIITQSYQVDDSAYVQKKKLSQRINKKEIGSEVF